MTLYDEAHSNYTFVKRAWRHLLLVVAALTPLVSHAHTAIAQVDGTPHGTLYAAWSYQTQKEADLAAVKGCRAAAKQRGLTKKAATCAVMHRQKGFGGGAIVCGAAGSNLSTGVDTQQDAVDRAFRQCEQQKMENCRTTDIISWWDEAGYGQRNDTKREPNRSAGRHQGEQFGLSTSAITATAYVRLKTAAR
ncbi:hypothetical protein [Massilia aquatica]|uniref:DUF4189 domain-containing protein n=1 Tax=Massilia aquatica TaxID=2609000 RepID=A0ABX0MN88_9BURK|nr:hypothetical protein [Massilia aquatica]NHZ43641.1 hypothetical protein [Massilia aquatica]